MTSFCTLFIFAVLSLINSALDVNKSLDSALDINKKAILEIEIAGKVAGKLHLKLFKNTPVTGKNFLGICSGKHPKGDSYAGIPFHRIIKNFMAQGGDTTRRDGTGGRSIYGEKFNDENFENKHTSAGLLSMANSGPNTNGAQFFITFTPTSWLNGKHVVFGCVTGGMDLLKTMESLGSQDGSTSKSVKIKSCTVAEPDEADCEAPSSTATEL